MLVSHYNWYCCHSSHYMFLSALILLFIIPASLDVFATDVWMLIALGIGMIDYKQSESISHGVAFVILMSILFPLGAYLNYWTQSLFRDRSTSGKWGPSLNDLKNKYKDNLWSVTLAITSWTLGYIVHLVTSSFILATLMFLFALGACVEHQDSIKQILTNLIDL
eukprot:NODE_5199_length_1051_cov_41.716595_g4640_i0.p1 GENE.NODE_5199_length_1051_cov_41.716595_g4640_i0~~NODE_5199_length_1051_cov_41.716595_g4640_i0.p1  ORF type:complete len:165 (+),score=13.39 NODE_5199_length_1051_cov_41.716595_g4640_i0:510-1004(+)